MTEIKPTQEVNKELFLTAYLFAYPTEEWWQNLPLYKEACAEIERPQSKEMLTEFFDYALEAEKQDYEDAYVRTFDFSQNTNLYLSTHNRTDFGKQSEELLAYKELFLKNGFDLDNEMPDYLPAILELAAVLPEEEAGFILKEVRPKLELLRERFIEAKLPYVFLMDVILTEATRLEGRLAG